MTESTLEVSESKTKTEEAIPPAEGPMLWHRHREGTCLRCSPNAATGVTSQEVAKL